MSVRVLVTGGAGYVGSHACKALAAAGYEPVTVDNLSRGFRESVRFGPFEYGDLRDAEFLDRVFERHAPQAVLHFAALAYVGESVEDPARYWQGNVAATLSLLDAMRRHDLPPLVFSSTCAVYGEPQVLPLTEQHPCAPVNPYGASKWTVERILADYHRAYGQRSIALRYFNAAGSDPNGEIGELHDPETHLIPLALLAILEREPPLTVFGRDWPTADGTCVRDYVHVCDLADAHVAALQALFDGRISHAYLNLGTGRGLSVAEILACCERVTGRPVPQVDGPRRAGDPAQLVADPQRAQDLLGWQAQRSDAHSMVASAWAFLSARIEAES